MSARWAKSREWILELPVGKALMRLTLPMILGVMTVMLSGVIDTFYVGRLGVDPLAALSFCFPVVFFVVSIALGLGIGASASLAKAIGENNSERVKQLSSHALVLAAVVGISVSLLGELIMHPLFTSMGVSSDLYPLVRSYMKVWLFAAPILMINMVGNNLLRATGETRTASLLMMFSTGVLACLDPLFIFGLWGFPALGLQGAAVAAGLAWSAALLLTLRVLAKHELIHCQLKGLGASWKQILFIGLPAMLTNLLLPLSLGVATAILSSFGPEVVAAYGVGGRLDMLWIVVVLSLSTMLTPFVGQNMGAGFHQRVHTAIRYSLLFSLAWQGLVWLLLIFVGPSIAHFFTTSVSTAHYLTQYLWILPASYGFAGMTMISSSVFNGLHQPKQAALITFVRLIIFYLPLTYIGTYFGPIGAFFGMALSNVLSGLFSAFLLKNRPEKAFL